MCSGAMAWEDPNVNFFFLGSGERKGEKTHSKDKTKSNSFKRYQKFDVFGCKSGTY